MNELRERSQELQDTILRNQALLRELSERIAEVLDGKVKLPEDEVYCFVPRVYRRPIFAPEIFFAEIDPEQVPDFIGKAGPYDPWIVKFVNKERLSIVAEQAQAAPEARAADLREQILRDQALFTELSDAIADVLDRHGVRLEADETYGFDAVTLRRPIFSAQLARPTLAVHERADVFAGKHLGAAAAAAVSPQTSFVPPWYEGVPPVDMLVALERLRLQYK